MSQSQYSADSILNFWFNEIDPKQWWVKSSEFDQQIQSRFCALHKSASLCELYNWRKTAHGVLAEIIILDQFSRNIYRDKPESFKCDPLALALAQTAVATKVDLELDVVQRAFIYLPFMHSESKIIHELAVKLFSQPGMEKNLEFELQHKVILDRFDRYPHRNEILGRPSSPDELDFLKTPGSSF